MSVFFGRNVSVDTKESVVVGRIEINKKAMRVAVYDTLDEIADLDRTIFKYVKNLDHRNILRDKIKRVRAKVNSL